MAYLLQRKGFRERIAPVRHCKGHRLGTAWLRHFLGLPVAVASRTSSSWEVGFAEIIFAAGMGDR